MGRTSDDVNCSQARDLPDFKATIFKCPLKVKIDFFVSVFEEKNQDFQNKMHKNYYNYKCSCMQANVKT